MITPDPAIILETGARVRVAFRADASVECDTTNNQLEATLPVEAALSLYAALIETPGIGEALVWQDGRGATAHDGWDEAQKLDLVNAILAIEAGRPIRLPGPPALVGGAVSRDDAWQIYLAHVAQSLRVEVHALVPWRLGGFSPDELRFLFDGRQLFAHNAASDRYRFLTHLLGSVTAWNPFIAHEFLSNLGCIRSTQLETILAFTDWQRAHLIHTLGRDDFNVIFGYPGLPPVDRVLYALEGQRHKTAGCWGTSGLFAAVLRSVNIPVRRANIRLLNGTHSRPEFVSVDRSMPHGDDPYTTTLLPSGTVIPSSRLLYTLADMQETFLAPEPDCHEGACNSTGEQASFNAGREHWALAHRYRSDALLYQVARHGTEYLDDSLRGPRIGGGVVEYVHPYFDAADRAAMIADALDRLEEIGGGDIEEGKRIVQDRYHRFGSNK